MKQVFVENHMGKPLEHDYDIMYDDNKRICFYSNNPEWVSGLDGEIVGHIKDTLNDIIIKIGKQTIKLDYAEYLVLKILIASDLNDTDSFEIRESKTIKKWGKGEDIEIVESLK